MNFLSSLLPDFLERFAERLRFPTLFWVTALMFVLDLLIPDLIPFADEILLGLGTLLLASWKRERGPEGEASDKGQADVIDVEPEP